MADSARGRNCGLFLRTETRGSQNGASCAGATRRVGGRGPLEPWPPCSIPGVLKIGVPGLPGLVLLVCACFLCYPFAPSPLNKGKRRPRVAPGGGWGWPATLTGGAQCRSTGLRGPGTRRTRTAWGSFSRT